MIDYACNVLLGKIKGYSSDLIIPIARGGLIPGTIMAYKANIKNIYPVYIKSYKEQEQVDVGFYVNPDVDYIKSFNNILIIDDLSDTGNTFNFFGNFLKNNNIINFKTASLYLKTGTNFIPDFYVSSFDNDVWLDFPWEV